MFGNIIIQPSVLFTILGLYAAIASFNGNWVKAVGYVLFGLVGGVVLEIWANRLAKRMAAEKLALMELGSDENELN